ncbi:WD40-repeat-containing domain protein [Xylogone sp. PMI_703]|nr:WD40-repeat-containing domain protein [Xylogone sp. PMI_703]
MAVKDESLYHATESLILPSPRKYYPGHIQSSHWQLRSLITSPKQNVIYYPHGSDIYRLDTETREREIVTTLSFAPRCLTASHDWICCGGEKGNYTAIYLGEQAERNSLDSDTSAVAEPDERLPLDLDPSRTRDSSTPTTSRRSHNRSYLILANVKNIGTEIVNCITIWFPPSKVPKQSYHIPLAVVSNNDSTVSIVDLAKSEVLEKLTLPDYVNRSVISPDGTMLVSICDDPFLYIHVRKIRSKDRFQTKQSSEYEFVYWGRIQLKGQRQADKSNMRGSFAATFSSSGKYLAVATQYGIISVFDTKLLTLEEYDPLLVSFTTSRPNRECGAVRSMEFSPDPFDLLAWTESSGRVGIADVRDLFLSRQMITLDSEEENIDTVYPSDRPGEPVIDPRLHSFRSDPPSSSTTPEYRDFAPDNTEQRRIRQLTREMLERQIAPLTAEELEVLEAHSAARRQRDAARDTTAQPGPSRWGLWMTEPRSSGTSSGGQGEQGNASDRIFNYGLPAALREFINNDRGAASFRIFINERNQERERRNQQLPRRRSSMILAAAENAIERETLGNNAAGDSTQDDSDDLQRLTRSGVAPTPRMPPELESSSTNPWAEIDPLHRSRAPGDVPVVDRSTRLRVQMEDDDRRNFAHRLRQPWRPAIDERDDTGVIRNVLRVGTTETTGCCWSQDGRILYVGTEGGLYEYHVNVLGRKLFPSLVFR